MDLFAITVTVAGLWVIITTTLSQVALWQQKEYRWDRLRAAITGFEQRRTIQLYLLLLAILIIGWASTYQGNYNQGNLIAAGGIALATFTSIYDTWRRGISRPKLTTKSIFLLLLTALIMAIYFFTTTFMEVTAALYWLTSALLILPITTGATSITNLLTAWRKRQAITRASKARQQHTQLTAVGITGSYGKTSTKSFIRQLIPEATVSKEHRNSDFVIAQDMLEQLNDQSRIYIAEMSAYTKGEIASLARLVRPTIGVITSISNQHLALFTALDALAQAKWELVASLPPDGTAILNADDKTIKKQATTWAGKTVWYSIEQPADVYVDDLAIHPSNIQCTLHIHELATTVTLPLTSKALLPSVLAAVATASTLGVPAQDIVKRLPNLIAPPRTMQLRSGKNGAAIIDDSYSANQKGVITAIEHLQNFPQADKRIALVPLIELGDEAVKVHQRIGESLKESKAKVFVYGHAYHKELGAQTFTNPDRFAAAVADNLTDNTVILLEGRIPDILRQRLYK